MGLGTASAVGAAYGLSVWGPAEPSAATTRHGSNVASARGKTLVIVELGGGNDGLNTVVPLNDNRYHDLRPTLGVTEPILLDTKLSGDEVGLHPSLPKLAARFDRGNVAIVEGLGYDDADLSHFGSFAIWWSALGGAGGGAGGAGWLGAYLDGTVGFDDPLAAIGIGPGPSPALRGRESFATTIANDNGLQPRLPSWLQVSSFEAGESLAQEWSDFTPSQVDESTLLGQVQRAIGLTVKARTNLAKVLSSAAESDTTRPTTAGVQAQRARYQDASVAYSLVLAAELVQSSAKPRIVYVNGVGDFDTHEGQSARHPALLQQLDDGIQAFFDALPAAQHDDVVLMTVSEFGRRPAENGSGTDHGTANVHLIVGGDGDGGVRGGRYGEPPSLTSLDRAGNLVHSADFRRLYATGLQWLGVDQTSPILGDDFEAFPVFH